MRAREREKISTHVYSPYLHVPIVRKICVFAYVRYAGCAHSNHARRSVTPRPHLSQLFENSENHLFRGGQRKQLLGKRLGCPLPNSVNRRERKLAMSPPAPPPSLSHPPLTFLNVSLIKKMHSRPALSGNSNTKLTYKID